MSELFLKLLNMSITASWLILAVVVLRLVLKKAPKWVNCLLWALVAVRLICPFSLESDLSLVPERVGSGELVSEWTGSYMDEVWTIPDTSEYYDGAVAAGREPIDGGNGHYYVVAKDDQLGAPATVENTVVPVLTAVWLAGMAILLLYALISCLRLRRQVSAAMPLGNKVWLCDAVESPFILGFFRPRIYLPSNMSEGDMEHVLAHERAHLRRRDHWWKPIGYVLLAVYWFNPLIWVAYILLCRDIELACDETVIKHPETDRKAYSEALLACSVKRSAVTACPLAFGEVSVRGRIKSVLNYRKPAFWIVLAALAACAAAAVCFLTDPVEEQPTVDDVLQQNGYRIMEMITDQRVHVQIPTDLLSGDAWTQEGVAFEPEAVILDQTNSTTLYLERVSGSDSPYDPDDLIFRLKLTHCVQESGTIRSGYQPVFENGQVHYRLELTMDSEEVSDSGTTYANAALYRGMSSDGTIIVQMKRDVVEQAADHIAFWLDGFTDVVYEKGKANREADIRILSAEQIRQETAESATEWDNNYASGLQLGKSIAEEFGNVPEDYQAYYNSEIESAIDYLDYITIRKQLNLTNGDKVPTYFLSPDRKTLIAVKQDKAGTNYSWTFVQNEAGEWEASDSQTKPSDQSVPPTVGTGF